MSRFGFGFGFGSQLIERGALMGTYRNFTTLSAAGSQGWDMDSAVTLTADFKLEFNAEPTSNAIRPLGAAGNFNNNVEITASLLTVDTSGTTSAIAGSFDIQEDAGALIHFWKLDEADPSSAVDSIGTNDLTGPNLTSADSEEFTLVGADWLGAELVTNGLNITTTTGWVEARSLSTLSAVGGNIRSTSDGVSTFGTTTSVSAVVGATYRASELIVRGDSVGTIFARVSEVSTLASDVAAVSFANPTEGLATLDFVATAGTMHIGAISAGHGSGEYIELSDITVKRILEAP